MMQYARALAVSLDGKTWQRLDDLGGRLGRFDIPEGSFELGDDRYVTPQGPGATYYDSITLTPAAPERTGVANGDFEYGSDFAHSGWSWSTREKTASAQIVADGHQGRGLKLQSDGEKDWILNSSGAGLTVRSGQTWKLSGRIKCKDATHLDLVVFRMLNGRKGPPV
jgi:hypothetical protein